MGIQENRTKQKLASGKPVFGIISGVSDPKIAELLGLNGFDYYMIDTEHSPMTVAQAVHIVRACELANVTPLARLSRKDPKAILPFLDAGVMGVMMPGLETAVEVEMLVQAIKYPPLGKRGLGVARAADYMIGSRSQADYVTFANQQTLVLPQFEDVALMGQLPAMTAVSGVDGIVIGPRDLALSMGYADSPNHPEVQNVIDEAIQIIRTAGLSVGITAGTQEVAQAQIARGCQFILGSLSGLVKLAAKQYLPNI